MAKFSNQQFLLQFEKAPQERAGCMAGSQWSFGMRDGWHTIPGIRTNNRGTQARFCQNGTTGENDVRSTVATQWPTNMCYEDALNLC